VIDAVIVHLWDYCLSQQFDVVASKRASPSSDWDSGAGGLFDFGDDFAMFGKATNIVLAPDLGAVGVDVKDAARAFDQLGVDP
jgi:hypothetical protein